MYFCIDVCNMWAPLATGNDDSVCKHNPLKIQHAKLNTAYKYNLTKIEYIGAEYVSVSVILTLF